jgi:hypothetical protein
MGDIELISTTTLPGLKPAATPFGANRAASTSGVSGTIVKMISARSATSRAFAHWVALLEPIDSGMRPSV